MADLPKTPSFRLEGRSALVVGASSGIGLACAVALAEAGAQVTLSARNTKSLEDLAAQMEGRNLTVNVLPLDISDVEGTANLISRHGPFNVLVNSAGTARHSAANETTVEDYDAVMGINTRGAYFLTQSVAKGLISAEQTGSLINISSQMSVVGGQDRAVYCASKHAVDGFTKAMAIEWGPLGIRVNTINPTFVRTPLTENTFADPEKRKWVEDKIKLNRVGEVEDLMGAVLYLASDASAMVTGSAMMVDGGWTAD